jgi:phosphohistidine phosphatase
MDLVLWRHAEAEAGEADLSRRLTAKGEKQARRMAAWLDDRLPDAARVLVSPAVRAQQTAAALINRKQKTVESLSPGASVLDVLSAAGWPDARQPVVIVGHQPTLGRVTCMLLVGEERDWPIKKGAVWWLQRRQRDEDEQVIVRAVINPDFA